MIEITINEAKKRLMNTCPGLYADFVSYLHDDDIIHKSYACESHGAIVIRTLYAFETFTWYICDVGNSDMNSALAEINEKFGNNVDKAMFCIGSYEGDNCISFSCIGEPYEDSSIRPLNENDREQILSVTTVPDDDSEYAKIISKNIRDEFQNIMNNPQKHILGIFDSDILAGVITFNNRNNGELIFISNVFVPYNYRKRGYTTRLIKAATAMYPDIRYVYSCGTYNFVSAASAKSAGYTFDGTYICNA
jgi:hypothetical protein